MKEKYKEDFKAKLKAVEAKIKDLTRKRQESERYRMRRQLMRVQLEAYGSHAPSQSHLRAVIQAIAQHDRLIRAYTERISEGQQIVNHLKELIKVAPRRPRTRLPESSIGASGVRGMRSTANPDDPRMAWNDGCTAAESTARDKYEMTEIPTRSLEIMERRWSELYPNFRLTRKNGIYHVVPTSVKRSVKEI
ncbi:hypothetical protein [Paludibaculum fermentans]|uniref:hypothetical protein n=1 Tax=Paludibaculum fermentans TaxID=1473598 RepID=UPI003EB9F7B2